MFGFRTRQLRFLNPIIGVPDPNVAVLKSDIGVLEPQIWGSRTRNVWFLNPNAPVVNPNNRVPDPNAPVQKPNVVVANLYGWV